MTRDMWVELIPVVFFISATITIGYIGEVVQRALRLHRLKRRVITKQPAQIIKYIEYRKAM